MKASIIIPTYNEVDNVEELVRAIQHVQPSGWDYDILIVDDNSPDGTYPRIKSVFKADAHVRAIRRTDDRGMARALRAGVEAASGDWIVLMGADFTHDPAVLPKMLHVAQRYDVVSGSRFCAGGNMDYLPHYLMSLVYNWLIRVILRTQIQDNLGCFVAIRRDALQQLPMDGIFFGYGDFFFRLLHYAQHKGMSIVEIPAHYRTRRKGHSKSHFFWLLFQYTYALVSFRIKLWRGSPDHE